MSNSTSNKKNNRANKVRRSDPSRSKRSKALSIEMRTLRQARQWK